MAFSADAVANYFLDRAAAARLPLSPMKLQKLMYFAHGFHLALERRGQPLVNEEVQAWEYGPVFPAIYHEFKEFGGRAISRDACSVKSVGGGDLLIYIPTVATEAEADPQIDLPFAQAVLSRVWSVYSPHSATALSELTHERGSPWWMIRQKAMAEFGGKIPRAPNIPNPLIRNWFKQRFPNTAASPT